MTTGLRVGVSVHDSLMTADVERRRQLLEAVDVAALDHVTVGDHVSFHGGTGFDGLVAATAVLAAHPSLEVLVGVYQLALRHPLVTARQLASIAQLAPGRLVLGVGVGGEDRDEISNCGVDPGTRGRRIDECLTVLRELADGGRLDHDGRFFRLKGAAVLPAPEPRVPLVIGGGGEVAVRRTAEQGDGWLGLFCSARRYVDTREQILDAAGTAGRDVSWFGLSVWCGVGADATEGRATLDAQLEDLYRLPGERFKHVTAAGTPEDIADFLRPFVEGGATHLTLIPAAGDPFEGIRAVGDVRRLLHSV